MLQSHLLRNLTIASMRRWHLVWKALIWTIPNGYNYRHHISDPYNRTDTTHAECVRIFVVRLKFRCFQTSSRSCIRLEAKAMRRRDYGIDFVLEENMQPRYVNQTCVLTAFIAHWRRSSLNTTRHIERIRGVGLAMMRYINRHWHWHVKSLTPLATWWFTVILPASGPAPRFCIFVFAQETRRPNLADSSLLPSSSTLLWVQIYL